MKILNYQQLNSDQKQQIIAIFNQGMECRSIVNLGRSGGLVGIVGSFEFACELAKRLGMGSVVEHYLRKVYYWRIYSRQHIKIFYNLIYQYPNLGLQRKKLKIEQILGSYKNG